MTTTAARAEVLTADVRVLMVGSRQVTVSVYEQLDCVRPQLIQPFGRVSRRRAHCYASLDCPHDCFDVVGRDREGMLVRSCASQYLASHREYARAWEALPLIVLAGLR